MKFITKPTLVISFILSGNFVFAQSFDPVAELRKYNVLWDTPSTNSLGSMPAGNGDIGINAWVERGGDLLIYLSKTDAWSENGQLLKLGKIRISLNPNPFDAAEPFRQELVLKDGEILVQAGSGSGKVEATVRVDANNPLAEVDIRAASPVSCEVSLEHWRTSRRIMDNPNELPAVYGVRFRPGHPIEIDKDTVLRSGNNRIIWYHHNSRSVWADNLRLQALGELVDSLPDPLLGRTFGAMVTGRGLKGISPEKLVTATPVKKISITVIPLTTTNVNPDLWLDKLNQQADRILSMPSSQRIEAHRKWWSDFWKRSYIFVDASDPEEAKKAEIITRGYILQRYINACGGRGNSPIKFNGSIFTVDTYHRSGDRKFDADFRLWGGPFWFQNTRLPYWAMLEAGDFDLMGPVFKMYFDALPLRKFATRKYYSHAGAFFPETMNFWGTYTDDNYGTNRTGMPDGLTENTYIRYYWTCGLELSLMMLDYYQFRKDEAFARDTLIPFSSEILEFFDKHWKRDIEGRILFVPAQALETYQTAVNPTPDIAGIRFLTAKLLELPESLILPEFRIKLEALAASVPEIPMRESDGVRVIAPAGHAAQLANIENPELYAIFPFRIHGVGKPDIELAINTFNNRKFTYNIGWQHSSIQAAYLGLADQAADLVYDKFSTHDKECRFPAFWGPNYDWSPDQDHGTVAMTALQRMLIHYEGDQVTFFPSWPEHWDVRFKLAAPGRTVAEGIFRTGKVVKSERY